MSHSGESDKHVENVDSITEVRKCTDDLLNKSCVANEEKNGYQSENKSAKEERINMIISKKDENPSNVEETEYKEHNQRKIEFHEIDNSNEKTFITRQQPALGQDFMDNSMEDQMGGFSFKKTASKISNPPNIQGSDQLAHEYDKIEKKYSVQLHQAFKAKNQLDSRLKEIEKKFLELKQHHKKKSIALPQAERKGGTKSVEPFERKKEAEHLNLKAKNLVRRMNWEKQQKEIREEQRRKKEEEKLEEIIKIMQERNEYLKERHIIRELSKNYSTRDHRGSVHENRKPALAKHRSTPLYKVMEKRYQEEVVLPQIEQRKRQLLARHEKYKPLEHQDIGRFEAQYEEYKVNKDLVKQKNREIHRISVPTSVKYNSIFKMSVLKNDSAQKNAEVQKQLERKRRDNVKKQYSQAVRDMFLPKSSPEREQIQKPNENKYIQKVEGRYLKSYEDYWRERSRYLSKVRSPTEIGMEPEQSYRRFEIRRSDRLDNLRGPLKQSGMKKAYSAEMIPRHDHIVRNNFVPPLKVVHKTPLNFQSKTERSPNDESASSQRKSYPNYLEELRRANIEGKHGKPNKLKQWDRYLQDKDMSYNERISYVLQDANLLENRAKLKQARLMRHSADVSSVNEGEMSIDELYIDSIKAKLAVLNKINEISTGNQPRLRL